MKNAKALSHGINSLQTCSNPSSRLMLSCKMDSPSLLFMNAAYAGNKTGLHGLDDHSKIKADA